MTLFQSVPRHDQESEEKLKGTCRAHAEEVPEQSLLNELPLQLRGEAVNCFLSGVFEKMEVFRHQRKEVLTLLASCLHPHTTLPGHNLSRQGSPADRLWILQTGDTIPPPSHSSPPPPPPLTTTTTTIITHIAHPSFFPGPSSCKLPLGAIANSLGTCHEAHLASTWPTCGPY